MFERDDSFAHRPSWSPDGNSIAFARYYDYDGSRSISIVNSTGGEARELVSVDSDLHGNNPPDFDLNDYAPDWSPDGTRIASTLFGEAFSVGIDGSDTHFFTKFDDSPIGRPVWSPRGDRIVGESGNGLVVFTTAGRLIRKLTPFGTQPAWQRLP